MRRVGTVVLLAMLIGAAGCISAQRYEELQAKHDELAQELGTTKHKYDAAQEDHLKATGKYEASIQSLQEQLTGEQRKVHELQSELGRVQKEYEAVSEAASDSAKANLKLIEEKKELNDSIIKLKGTILTLRDKIKDLQDRLAEQSPTSESGTSVSESGP